MARRRWVGERQPGVQRHEARLGAGADQHQNEDERDEAGGDLAVADRIECVGAVRSGQQSEGDQQRKRAEARHHQYTYPARRFSRTWSCAITSAQEERDMNSQENKKVKASSAMTTSVMPARNSG